MEMLGFYESDWWWEWCCSCVGEVVGWVVLGCGECFWGGGRFLVVSGVVFGVVGLLVCGVVVVFRFLWCGGC